MTHCALDSSLQVLISCTAGVAQVITVYLHQQFSWQNIRRLRTNSGCTSGSWLCGWRCCACRWSCWCGQLKSWRDWACCNTIFQELVSEVGNVVSSWKKCGVHLHISWIEEAFRLTLKVSLLFAASTKVWVTVWLCGSSAVGIKLLNTTPIWVLVGSDWPCGPTARLHLKTEIEVMLMFCLFKGSRNHRPSTRQVHVRSCLDYLLDQTNGFVILLSRCDWSAGF